MRTPIKLATLRESAPIHPPDVKPLPIPPNRRRRITVTLVLRSRASDRQIAAEIKRIGRLLPHERPRLSYGELVQRYGARPEDLRRVSSYFTRHGFLVREVSRARRAVVIGGTLEQFSRVFGVNFHDYGSPGVRYCSHDGDAKIPRQFAGVIEGVLGLDHRPLFRPHLAMAVALPERFTNALDVSRIYKFPDDTDGKGQTIAIHCLGGGFYRSDIRAYFRRRGLRAPRVTVVELQGAGNRPAQRAAIAALAARMRSGGKSVKPPSQGDLLTLWTIEATMDVELAGSFAPGADIVVYFAPNTGRGRYEAFTRAVANRTHAPAVHSCSWGMPEGTIPEHVQRLVDKAFRLAALKGITLCVASGDSGLTPVNFPASSPHALACGGTHLHRNNGQVKETVWNEKHGKQAMSSSGGFSKIFKRPHWQSPSLARQHRAKGGRGVPDVAAKADLRAGYEIIAGGHRFPMGGTSAAAPLWAGLIARLNQKLGVPVGFLNPLLYSRGFERMARDIIHGDNGRYDALPGWDACTGVGAPDGERLLAALTRYT